MDANHTPDLGRTADGATVTDGLAVFTNEMRVGVVRTDRYRTADDGWFDVEYADGRRVMQNGERVATRFDGEVAETAWSRELAALDDGAHDMVEPPAPPTEASGSTVDNLRAALELIAGRGCATSASTVGACFSDDNRTADARYGADRACEACVAHYALNGLEIPRGPGEHADE